jgi:hypothetical protein
MCQRNRLMQRPCSRFPCCLSHLCLSHATVLHRDIFSGSATPDRPQISEFAVREDPFGRGGYGGSGRRVIEPSRQLSKSDERRTSNQATKQLIGRESSKDVSRPLSGAISCRRQAIEGVDGGLPPALQKGELSVDILYFLGHLRDSLARHWLCFSPGYLSMRVSAGQPSLPDKEKALAARARA